MNLRRPLLALPIVLAACGGSGAAAGNGTDRGFVAEMTPHHASAVEMAEIALERGESPFVRKLATDIVRTQRAEIATMREQDAELAERGVARGKLGVPGHMMGMDDDPASLRGAPDFDRAFLSMMVPHHAGAVTMAKVELAKGADPELKALARDIVAAQRRELAQMRAQLAG